MVMANDRQKRAEQSYHEPPPARPDDRTRRLR
jgi:hypothetical protein